MEITMIRREASARRRCQALSNYAAISLFKQEADFDGEMTRSANFRAGQFSLITLFSSPHSQSLSSSRFPRETFCERN